MIFYFLFNILGVLAAPFFIRTVWKNWHLPVSIPITLFISVFFSICLLSLYGMTVDAVNNQWHIQINLLVGFTTPVLWFWVTYEYIRREKIPLALVVVLLIEPLILIVAALTNNYFDLANNQVLSVRERIELHPILIVRLFHLFFALGLIAFSLIWLGRYLLKTSHLGIVRVLVLMVLLSLPVVSFFLYIYGYIPVRVGSALSIVFIALGVSRFKLLDVVPIARDKVVDQLKDGIAILDRKGFIVDANRFACDLLGVSYQSEKQTVRSVSCPEVLIEHFSFKDTQIQKQNISFSDQLKSNFLTNISHEFRTPLTLSLGPINDVLEGRFGEVTPAVNQQLISVSKHNQRLLELINQLLDLSRLEAVGDMDRDKVNASIDVVDVLPVMIDSFNAIAKKKQVEMIFVHDLDVANIQMKLSDFEKIIHNLLSNALKSIDQDGVITVRVTESDEDTIVVSLKDTGCGIGAELLPHIFERFYYSEHQHPQWSASTGIGLALVKQLIESHGGGISVESEDGAGSLFVVHLPKSSLSVISSKPEITSAKTEMPSTKPVLMQETNMTTIIPANSKDVPLVLVVEDNDDMREYILSHLNGEYRLLEAANGEDGLLLAQEQVPDLIVSDIMMPGINGVDLCKEIKTDVKTSHIPFILLSAKAEIKDKLEGLAVEANDYLTKPFDSTVVMKKCFYKAFSKK